MATPRDVALANARALRKFMQGQGEVMSNLSEEYLTPLIDELLDGGGDDGPATNHVGVNPTLKYQVVSGGKASPSKGYSDSVSLNPVGEEWPDDDGEGWVIRATHDDDTGPLYWSNDDGWVDKPSATRFESKDFNLPVGASGWEVV